MTRLPAPVKTALRGTTTRASVARMWSRIEARERARPRTPMRRGWPLLVAVAAALLAVSTAFALGWPRRAGTGGRVRDAAPRLDPSGSAVTFVPSDASLVARPTLSPAAVAPSSAPRDSAAARAPAPVPAAPSTPRVEETRPARPSTPASAPPTWRDLAAGGDAHQAYAALGPDGVVQESQSASVDDLFALADVARLSGHATEAVAPLERIASEHANDPRAPLAALTLGRIQLRSLGAPAAAARAVERALALGLPEGVVEDAYGLLVESRAKAGEADAARAAYARLVARFPRSERAAELRARLGLELEPRVAPP